MSNLNVNINLLKLKAAVMTVKGKVSNKKCVVIPIEDNDLYSKVSDDGKVSVYLGMTLWEANGQYGDTHIVKQSHSQQWNESHTDEQKREEPILGNARPVKDKSIEQLEVPEANIVSVDSNDDLPF